MSPLLINSATTGANSINKPTIPAAAARTRQQQKLENPIKIDTSSLDDKIDEDDEEAREEERKATGRTIAIVIFLSLMCLALYHVIQKKTTILAGVLVPAMILFTYTFFVIHISQKDKKKRRKELEESGDLEMSISSVDHKKTPIPNASISSGASLHPSTSGHPTSSKPTSKIIDPRLAALRSANLLQHHPLTHKSSSSSLHQLTSQSVTVNDAKKPFKKTKSQSHIQVANRSAAANAQPSSAQIAIQHETKKLKKSRSFDKNNYLMDSQPHQSGKKSHVTDSSNKRPKQQKSSSTKFDGMLSEREKKSVKNLNGI